MIIYTDINGYTFTTTKDFQETDSVSSADQKAVTDVIKDTYGTGGVAAYEDLTIYVVAQKNGEKTTVGTLNETNSQIEYTIDIPQEQQGKNASDYNVVRVHDGQAQTIGCTVNQQGTQATFKSDKFSIFALVYSGHNIEKIDAKAPTCTEDGNSEYYRCTDCGELYNDADGLTKIDEVPVINKTGHSLKEVPVKAATETEQGWETYWVCETCHYMYSDSQGINKLNSIPYTEVDSHTHNLTRVDEKAPTCTEPGNVAYYVCDCGKYFSDAEGITEITKDQCVLAASHKHMTEHKAVAATCTTAGNSTYWYCSDCQKYFSDADGTAEITKDSWVINAKGHSMTAHECHAATCTEAGNTAYWSCSDCEKYFSDAEGVNKIDKDSWVIEAMGHDWDAGETDDGVTIYSCQRQDCGATKIYVDESIDTENLGDDAQKEETPDGLQYAYINKKAVITGYVGSNASLMIPASIDGKVVIGIGAQAFASNTTITSVTVNAGIDTISSGAFDGCCELTTVVLPDSVEEIQSDAFRLCSKLTSITIPEKIKKICGGSFYGCSALSGTITLDGTEIAGQYAFDASGITGIVLKNVNLSGTSAFESCQNLQSINLTNVTTIPYSTFRNCKALDSVTLSGITDIDACAFNACTSLKTITLPNGAATIGDSAFADCTMLSGVYIPASVTSIVGNAFDNDLLLFISAESIGDTESFVVTWVKNKGIASANIHYQSQSDKEDGKWIGDIDSDELKEYDSSKGLNIISESAQIYFDKNAVDNIKSEIPDGYEDDIYIGCEPVKEDLDTGNDLMDQSINNARNEGSDVYNFNLSKDEKNLDNKDEKINFGGSNGGNVDVTISTDKNKNNVSVYYVDEKGDKSKIVSNYNKDTGEVTFNTTHFSYYTIEEDSYVKFDSTDVTISHSATLNENLAYNYYYTLGENGSLFGTYDSVWLELQVQDYSTADAYAYTDEKGVGYNIVTKRLDNWTPNTSKGYSRYRFSFKGIAAPEIGNTISATLHATKNGIEYYTEADISSIKSYAYNRIENSQSSYFKTMLVDMLNYCASAQTYFGYNETQLVNADLTAEQKALGTQEDIVPTQSSERISLEGAATANISSVSIVLGNSVEIKYYMTLDSGVNVNDVKLVMSYTTILDENVEVTVDGSDFGYDSENSRYYAKLSTIASPDAGAIVSAKICNKSDGTAISDTLNYGIEVYCKNRLEKSTNNDFKALLRNLLKYTRSSATYFTSLQ